MALQRVASAACRRDLPSKVALFDEFSLMLTDFGFVDCVTGHKTMSTPGTPAIHQQPGPAETKRTDVRRLLLRMPTGSSKS